MGYKQYKKLPERLITIQKYLILPQSIINSPIFPCGKIFNDSRDPNIPKNSPFLPKNDQM